jgi:hypothetical protein
MLTDPKQIIEFLNNLLIEAHSLQDAYPLKDVKQTARRLDFYRIMATAWYGLFEDDFDVNFKLLTIADFRKEPYAWCLMVINYYRIQQLGIEHARFTVSDKQKVMKIYKDTDIPLNCGLIALDLRYGDKIRMLALV